jgi:hypothetical protein
MSDETNQTERYWLDVQDGYVAIVDQHRCGIDVQTFTGPDRLLAATGRLAELNQAETTPAAFLAETLPAFARTQRREVLLAELNEIERIALREISGHAEILSRTVKLRDRILAGTADATGSPLSEPVSAQEPAGVPVTTPKAVQALTDAQSPDLPAWLRTNIETTQAKRRGWEPIERQLFKPGPY